MSKLISRATSTLDGLGVIALVGAGLCLGAALWFVDDLLKGFFLQAMFRALIATVVLFVAARVLELVAMARAGQLPGGVVRRVLAGKGQAGNGEQALG